jgi:hypothetical protein
MSIEADPKNTWAVVVGIDHYGEGFPKLKHQVESACGFTQWLIGRGVPPNQIYLHLSPPPDSISLEINLRDASENTIFDTLNQELRSGKGDLLYIYWGGHGIVAGNDRTLITADASIDALQSIDLNSLLSSLRSNHFSFSQQAVLVDACARHFPDQSLVNPRRFTQGRKLPAQKQFVLYSAAEAESATDGLFSAAMLEWLKSAGKAPIVPDLEQMAEDMRRHFIQLRAEGRTHQTPVYFSHKPWEDEEKALIGESRFLSLLPKARALLSEVGFSPREWKHCYRRTFRDHGEDFVEAESPEQALYHLARSVQANRIELLLEFLWRIAEIKDREEIRRWVRKQVGYQYKLEELMNQMLRERLEESTRTAYLLIEVLEPLGNDPNLRLHRWLYLGEKPSPPRTYQCANTREALRDAIIGMVEDLEGGDETNDQELPAIEIFVATRWLGCPAEKWKYEYAPLGSKYSLVLRWHERLRDSSPRAKRWRRLAKQIHDRMELQAEPSIFWAPDEAPDYEKLASRCGPQFDRSFLGFSDQQVDEEQDDVGIFLLAALANGIPYTFFPRKKVGSDFKAAFIKKVNELNRWDDLPKQLIKMRSESINDDDHPAAKVTLLWDDPRRIPPRANSPS